MATIFIQLLAEAPRTVLGLAPAFMALAAGSMVFFSLHELVPLAAEFGQPGAFVGGAVLCVAVYGMLL